MNYSALIYAFEQENIAITGEGTLDGSASNETWWGWAIRPTLNAADAPSSAKNDASSSNAPSSSKTKRAPGVKVGKSLAAPTIDKLVDLAEHGAPVSQRDFGADGKMRPNFVTLYRCKNILIEGVTSSIRSPMWELHPVSVLQHHGARREIQSHGPNNDGCDPGVARHADRRIASSTPATTASRSSPAATTTAGA